MLYLAFPVDLRDRFSGSEWLIYPKQVQETRFTPEDTVVLSEWIAKDRAELLQILHTVQKTGARIVYVGSKTEETEEWKRQLCLYRVYDFLFFGEEMVLKELEDLLEHPRSPQEVARYLPESKATSVPTIVEEAAEAKKRSRFRWPIRKVPESPVLNPRPPSALWVVMGLWPRSGVSTVAQLLAKTCVETQPGMVVTILEGPRSWPRLWEYFQLEIEKPLDKVKFWTQDGKGEAFVKEGVQLVPLPPGKSIRDEKWIPVVLRYVKQGLTIVDADDLDETLLSLADQVWCVLDCDPTYLALPDLGEKYQILRELAKDKLITVMNKWTSVVRIPRDVFESPVTLPYLPPEKVQRALWEGRFFRVEEHLDVLEPLVKWGWEERR
ncbi:hypothetical protein FY534_13970 (plasmid) [Alicyclobacillus sp. TC]|uniref:ParA family protein n=1 Tax=Alicyclobacillus tolerans TaxID=90970 RepID=A0ABT9LYN2_9BACL|nr:MULTISPECIES: hypothetical protein [Alicyclobacillus]MDP9729387.1 hypothetical protein [Alicyclobacillus tengchongensis]QRF24880.1 hypothetical protein FY534_13970 [Alicyclobacillus sp. TC]